MIKARVPKKRKQREMKVSLNVGVLSITNFSELSSVNMNANAKDKRFFGENSL